MSIPEIVRDPPFNITRASHVRYYVKDLSRSVEFYTEILGFVVSANEDGIAYLRGIEESCHHSVVLMQNAEKAGTAECIGMRVAGFVRLQTARPPDSEGSCLIYPTCPASRVSDFRAP